MTTEELIILRRRWKLVVKIGNEGEMKDGAFWGQGKRMLISERAGWGVNGVLLEVV
jgi:hypothetical protein